MFDYYDNGEEFFRDSDIFINKCKIKECAIHAHSFIEIAFITDGSGVHKVGNRNFPCTKGEMYIINHDIPHQFIADLSCELEIYNCIFQPIFFNYSFIDSKKFYDITHSFLINLLDGKIPFDSPKITLPDHIFKSVMIIYENMLIEYEEKYDGYIEILKAELVKLIIFILRVIKKVFNIDNTHCTKNKIFEDIIQYIHSNYYNQISIEELAMMVFLSKSHFCRLFKEYSGMNVAEYTQKIRIQKACELLHRSNQKISHIATEVGYNDLKHFISLFKKYTGKTPSQYRKII